MAKHIQKRENPLPLVLSIKVSMRTGKDSLVNILAERGLIISYDRLRHLNTDLANSVITLSKKIGEVVPVQAIRGKFTTDGIDNIDYNPSSTTAAPDSVLHCTSISILQHFTYGQETQLNLRYLIQSKWERKQLSLYQRIYLQWNTMSRSQRMK